MVSFKSLKKVRVIGLMSGTSLDGLDLCFVEFEQNNGEWTFLIKATKGLPYSTEWREKLNGAFFTNEKELQKLDKDFGTFLGNETSVFMKENGIFEEVHLITSHGHTIFHEPAKGITVQIGDGKCISQQSKKPVVNNFRIKDVQLGGQGAPLVPVGDAFLFSEFDACLNLGGIANISYQFNNERIAFDIAPCNLPLNKIMRHNYQKEYDNKGQLAESGNCIPVLLAKLDQLEFYKKNPPKSLGVEWLNDQFYPILAPFLEVKSELPNVLHTIVLHEVNKIAEVLNQNKIESVLVTGGGAFNTFLIDALKARTTAKIIIPTDEIVDFKEALIFAFLGLLNVIGEVNTFKSVTGATHDSIGGFISYP